jgi:hypothetical protein
MKPLPAFAVISTFAAALFLAFVLAIVKRPLFARFAIA